jgi:hypothetical protein
MRDLLAEDYTLRMSEGASRSRSPQVAILDMRPAVPACRPKTLSPLPSSKEKGVCPVGGSLAGFVSG